MKKSRFADEQIVVIVRQADANSVADVARKHQVTEQVICDRLLDNCRRIGPKGESTRGRKRINPAT